MEEKPDEDLVTHISKLVIIIPILVIMTALYIKFTKRTQRPTTQILKKNITAKPSSEGFQLNLKGPFICEFSLNTASMSAFILNKRIFIQMEEGDKTSKLLVNGDCYYRWEKNTVKGRKTCGISSYLSTLDTLMTMNVVTADNLARLIPQEYSNKISSNGAQLTKVFRSCTKKDIDQTVFSIPKEVQFEDAAL